VLVDFCLLDVVGFECDEGVLIGEFVVVEKLLDVVVVGIVMVVLCLCVLMGIVVYVGIGIGVVVVIGGWVEFGWIVFGFGES